ncbi:MAG: DUF2938 family protein, partial [Thermoleophilia bacterium]
MTGCGTLGRHLPPSILVGVLATATMDLAMIAAARIDGERFVSEKLDPAIVGRWVASSCRGRWRHDDIVTEPAATGEAAIGIVTHYVTGVSLTWSYFLLLRLGGSRSSLAKATAFGAATALLPFLVMYPAWGYGPFGLRADAARLARIMLLGHTAFGAATALLPFLVMYPAWGYGAFGLRDPDAARLARGMLLGHTAFGVGIGGW